MPNIELCDIETLRQTELGPYVDRSLEQKAPDPGFFAVMGHNPKLAETMYLAWMSCSNTGRIEHRIKEIMRLQLSRMAHCSY